MAREAEMIETYVRGKEAIRQVDSISKLSHLELSSPHSRFLPPFY